MEILTITKVRADDSLGSGSNDGERVNGSKNKNGEHFRGKQL